MILKLEGLLLIKQKREFTRDEQKTTIFRNVFWGNDIVEFWTQPDSEIEDSYFSSLGNYVPVLLELDMSEATFEGKTRLRKRLVSVKKLKDEV